MAATQDIPDSRIVQSGRESSHDETEGANANMRSVYKALATCTGVDVRLINVFMHDVSEYY